MQCYFMIVLFVSFIVEVGNIVAAKNRGIGIRETREYYLCYLMSCDDSSLFRCVTRIQAINFFRKVKYNLLKETI